MKTLILLLWNQLFYLFGETLSTDPTYAELPLYIALITVMNERIVFNEQRGAVISCFVVRALSPPVSCGELPL